MVLIVPDESAQGWKRHRGCTRITALRRKCGTLGFTRATPERFYLVFFVAAFTVTADFTLAGYPAAARTLSATSSSLGAAGYCFVSGSYPSPTKTLRLRA